MIKYIFILLLGFLIKTSCVVDDGKAAVPQLIDLNNPKVTGLIFREYPIGEKSPLLYMSDSNYVVSYLYKGKLNSRHCLTFSRGLQEDYFGIQVVSPLSSDTFLLRNGRLDRILFDSLTNDMTLMLIPYYCKLTQEGHVPCDSALIIYPNLYQDSSLSVTSVEYNLPFQKVCLKID